jgi:hypothetical protein
MIPDLALAAAIAFTGGVDAVRALATDRPEPEGPTTLERIALESRADPLLEQLRAGAPLLAPAAPAADERAALDQAQQDAQDLESQRAGDLDLSDRELAIIAITAGAVLLLVLLL